VTDVWEARTASTIAGLVGRSMTIDGKKWGVPYTYYQWGIYYNKDAYKKAGVEVPAEDLGRIRRRTAKSSRPQGIDCLTTGSKAAVAGCRHLRLHEPAHQRLRIPHGPDRRQGSVDRPEGEGNVFAEWAKIQPYTRRTMPPSTGRMRLRFVQGKAANYVMGNFAVATFKEGGMTNENLGFMVFPEITAGVPRAEEAPTDTIHIPAGAKNGRCQEVPGLSSVG
jgi:multiple sugar transport system substrate-binding protein